MTSEKNLSEPWRGKTYLPCSSIERERERVDEKEREHNIEGIQERERNREKEIQRKRGGRALC